MIVSINFRGTTPLLQPSFPPDFQYFLYVSHFSNKYQEKPAAALHNGSEPKNSEPSSIPGDWFQKDWFNFKKTFFKQKFPTNHRIGRKGNF
jgi:hypothetical protein